MADFNYEAYIANIPDYPKPGVQFKDITPLLDDHTAYTAMVEDFAQRFANSGATKVMGPEARGFLVGAPVALKMGLGFVPARKPGKLPRAVISQEFDLEYGTDEIQLHADALEPGDKVLSIDDLIATGGTVCAQTKLVQSTGAEVVGYGFLIELAYLNPREKLAELSDAPVESLIVIESE